MSVQRRPNHGLKATSETVEGNGRTKEIGMRPSERHIGPTSTWKER